MKHDPLQLVGRTLKDGWLVNKILDDSTLATGGCFSVGYFVTHTDGRTGFLKALNYQLALRAPDPALALKELVDAFIFERNLLERCQSRRLKNIVKAIGHGTIDTVPHPIQYLIFEVAELGDVRRYMATLQNRLDSAWKMRTAHSIAVAIRQLHSIGVAHQDLKPSNVLVFDHATSKVGDLGCASSRDASAKIDEYLVPGDPTYAPPELVYRSPATDWVERRFGCDLYHLGSMIFFLVLGVPTTPMLWRRIGNDMSPENWRGSFEDAIPFLEDAFSELLEELRCSIPPEIAPNLMSIARELCHPNPVRRGNPKGKSVTQRCNLEQYVSRLDHVASVCEVRLKGHI
jgi:Serine/threonine protein kinase